MGPPALSMFPAQENSQRSRSLLPSPADGVLRLRQNAHAPSFLRACLFLRTFALQPTLPFLILSISYSSLLQILLLQNLQLCTSSASHILSHHTNTIAFCAVQPTKRVRTSHTHKCPPPSHNLPARPEHLGSCAQYYHETFTLCQRQPLTYHAFSRRPSPFLTYTLTFFARLAHFPSEPQFSDPLLYRERSSSSR